MSIGEQQEKQWVVYVGDFPILKNFLSKKKYDSPWIILKLLDAVLRGYGQVILANNPISGMLIAGAFAVVVPGMMLTATCAGILGLLLSMLIGESKSRIENGLTVYNPLLCGAITYSLTPNIFDGRLILYLLMSIVFSVYLTRALDNGKFPCLTAPFNTVQIIFMITLASRSNDISSAVINDTEIELNVTTASNLFAEDNVPRITNATSSDLDWGLVFRGIVTSSSQIFALDSVALSSIIYLAILTYSPITAVFSITGAMLGSFTGLALGVSIEEIYSGVWGYNGLLTCGAIGGLFIIVGSHTTIAAVFASIFATMLQNVLTPLFTKIDLPVLSIPFVLTTWLFLGLRDSEGSGFIKPNRITFPEKQRYDCIEAQQPTIIFSESDDSNELDISTAERRSLK